MIAVERAAIFAGALSAALTLAIVAALAVMLDAIWSVAP
jgi:hypothetical protein